MTRHLPDTSRSLEEVIEHWLKAHPPLSELVEYAHKLGETLGFVGGVVRDLLLGETMRSDFDLLYTGPLTPLKSYFQERYRIHLRPSYLNLTLFASGIRLDVGQPRRDHYPLPGAIPEIHPATLEEDLKRRDFTWNALFLSLTPRTGEITDPFQGVQDLRLGVIRPLYPWTLLEDPIRILRGLRYQSRFGFQRTEEWESALKKARSPSFFDTVAPGRIGYELKRFAGEEKSWRIWRLLAETGVDRGLFGSALKSEDLEALEAAGTDPGLIGQRKDEVWLRDLLILLTLDPKRLAWLQAHGHLPKDEIRRLKNRVAELLRDCSMDPYVQKLKNFLYSVNAEAKKRLVELQEFLR